MIVMHDRVKIRDMQMGQGGDMGLHVCITICCFAVMQKGINYCQSVAVNVGVNMCQHAYCISGHSGSHLRVFDSKLPY